MALRSSWGLGPWGLAGPPSDCVLTAFRLRSDSVLPAVSGAHRATHSSRVVFAGPLKPIPPHQAPE